jgi:hypothetical protein
MKATTFLTAVLLSGCAAYPALTEAPAGRAPAAVDQCRAEVANLNAQLAAEIAERERVTRMASRREEALRRQLDAMKAIERGILEREDRVRSETR